MTTKPSVCLSTALLPRANFLLPGDVHHGLGVHPSRGPALRKMAIIPKPTGSTKILTSRAAQNAGLSTGAKAGIGVGVAVGFCIIFLASYLCYIRRRKAKALEHPAPSKGKGPRYEDANYSDLPEVVPWQPVSSAIGSSGKSGEESSPSSTKEDSSHTILDRILGTDKRSLIERITDPRGEYKH